MNYVNIFYGLFVLVMRYVNIFQGLSVTHELCEHNSGFVNEC